MTNSEFQTEWEAADKKFRRDYGVPLTTILTWGVISSTLLATAAVKAKRGNYPSAIFFALLWQGFSNNTNHSVLFKQIRYLRGGK